MLNKVMKNSNLLVCLIGILILVCFLIQTSMVIATFDSKNISTWTAEDFDKVLKDGNQNGDINSAWKLASLDVRKKFIEYYAKYKKINFKIENLESKDLEWDGTSLTNKKAWFNFENNYDFVAKIKYDDKTKTFEYEFSGERIVKIDEGTITKDGEHQLKKDVSASEKKISFKYGEKGNIEYKNGQYSVFNRALLKIGNNLYSSGNAEKGPGFVRFSNEILEVKNIQIDFFKTGRLDTSLVIRTDFDIYTAVFTDTVDHSAYNSPYIHADLENMAVKIDMKDTKAYADGVVLDNFKIFAGKGENVFLRNGESVVRFKDKNLVIDPNSGITGKFEIESIYNLDNANINSENNFAFSKKITGRDSNGNPVYAESSDFFNKKEKLNGGVLISRTDGLYVRGRGSEEVGFSDVSYNKEFSPEYFKGSEEERINAIIFDSNTIASIHSSPTIRTPGDFAAANILLNMDFSMARAELALREMSEGLSEKFPGLANSIGDFDRMKVFADIIDKMVIGELESSGKIDFSDPATREKIISSLALFGGSSLSESQKRANAQLILDVYFVYRSYDSNAKMSGLSQQQIDSLPGFNRFLYELKSNYPGEIIGPSVDTNWRGKAKLRSAQKPASSGGFDKIEMRSDGVYVTDSKGAVKRLEGIDKNTYLAFKSVFSQGLYNFESQTVKREKLENDIQKYPDLVEKYPFDFTGVLQKDRNQNDVYYLPLLGLRAQLPSVIDDVNSKIALQRQLVDYYTKKGRL